MLESPSVDEAEKGLVSLALKASLSTLVPPSKTPSLRRGGSSHIDGPSEKVSTETKSLDPKTAHPTAVQSSPKAQQPPAKSARRKTSRWIRFQLWFNTYRYVAPSPVPLRKLKVTSLFHAPRKFFTLAMSINIAGIICAATGKWNHPRNFSGACVLGNLLLAILMRNELFGRFLYLIVNTCFAKVALSLCFPLISPDDFFSGPLFGFVWVAHRHSNTSVAFIPGVLYQDFCGSSFAWP